MYRLLLYIFLPALLSFTGSAQTHVSAPEGPAFSFVEIVHDFGRVPADTPVEYKFEFANTGNGMLIINDVSLSCPCFLVDWIRGPVMPGEKGWISVNYPTGSKEGPFDKLIWITSNAINNTPGLDKYELRIKGEVLIPAHSRQMPPVRKNRSN